VATAGGCLSAQQLHTMHLLQQSQVWHSVVTPTHTHTHLTALCLGLPGSAGTRKLKPVWILLKQETVSGSGISWAVCKSAPRSRQITIPAPPPLSFLQAGCPSCRPTNSVKALKAQCSHSCCLHNFILFILLLVQPVFLVVIFVMSQPFDSSVV